MINELFLWSVNDRHYLLTPDKKTEVTLTADIDSGDNFKILMELMPKGIKKELVSQLQWQISAWKNAGLSPEEAVTSVPMAIDVYQQYCEH